MLIFDDAMSGLDEDAEAVIQQNMVHIAQGRTLFVMAHRLSAVRQAHCVYVVERGEIVEQGTHDELLRAGGSYTRLHAYQAGSER
jgi:subfamily B ATP-binding cassette protein HlyB/CyaB